MTEHIVDISPDPNMILAELHRERFGWAESFGELIDNSLDANATRVTIEIDRVNKQVVITDNGKGCAEPERMLISGSSGKRAKDGLGRFGVGLKHASYFLTKLEGMTQITTCHSGKSQVLQVCWGDVVRSKKWQATSKAVTQLNLFADKHGTQIKFGLARERGALSKDQWQGVLSKLAFMFSPGLREGRQIEFRGIGTKPQLLKAPEDPSWSESLTFDVAVGTKTARVRAGIKAADDKSGQTGLAYIYRHRVIISNSSLGCGQFNIGGIAGFVELDHTWSLGTNKSEITDPDIAELAERILERLQPLLEKAHHATKHIRSEALCRYASEVLSKFAQVYGYGKARRPNRRGSWRSKSEDPSDRKPVEQATIVGGDGKVRGIREMGGGFTVETVTRPDDKRAGWTDPQTNRIFLNAALPRVAQIIDAGASEFVLLAAAHFFRGVERRREQAEFGADAETFEEMLGVFMAATASMGVARVV